MEQRLTQTWELETIFAGGSASPALSEHLELLSTEIDALQSELTTGQLRPWPALLAHLQELIGRLHEAGAFLYCLLAQDGTDQVASQRWGRCLELLGRCESLETQVQSRLLELPEPEWAALLADPQVQPIAFTLTERRAQAQERMAPALEMLATSFNADGPQAWEALYTKVSNRIRIPHEADLLSVGQAFLKFSDPDPAVRRGCFERYERAWEAEAELCAAALNHIAGFRLTLGRHRGRTPLTEALQLNRMTEQCLEAMWGAVESASARLGQFLRRRTELMGETGMHWVDQYAPLDQNAQTWSYEEAAALILQEFHRFSPPMAKLAEQMLHTRQVEAENRPGKGNGAFEIDFPHSRQHRVFMTFGGDAGSLMTLAHELGHAYHSHLMLDLPFYARAYSVNLAETASNFAERLVGQALIERAATKRERLVLLDQRLMLAVSSLMNVRARFLFEQRFLDARSVGPVGPDQLGALMAEAQQEAFGGALQRCYPAFWCSLRHAYNAQRPFYNFPYTFGFLLSTGLQKRALDQGPAFSDAYANLLRDTGRMTVSELGRRHLGVDLAQPDFWQESLAPILADVDAFLSLSESAEE